MISSKRTTVFIDHGLNKLPRFLHFFCHLGQCQATLLMQVFGLTLLWVTKSKWPELVLIFWGPHCDVPWTYWHSC